MAALDFHRAANTGFVGQVLNTLTSRFKSWNDDRATRRALSKLSKHELEDIGLNPGDVDNMRYSGLIR